MRPSEERKLIIDTIEQYLRDRLPPEIRVASIQSGYSSGNPTLRLGWEDGTSQGTKASKIPQPYSNRNGLPTADQKTLTVGTSERRDWIPTAPLIDLADLKVDSDYLMGLRPVAPGNTVIVSDNAEESTTSATYVTVKTFHLTRPGSYRVSGELARSGGLTRAKLAILWPDGVEIDASSEATLSTGATHPTYPAGGNFTLDMNKPLPWGGVLLVKLANDSGPAQTAFIQSVSVKYSDATASMTPYDAAI
jgi:hypothetical protein